MVYGTVNQVSIFFPREDLIYYQFPQGADFRIRVATYNVNDRLPPKDTIELATMVGQGEEDLLVFGFQEVGEFCKMSGVIWLCEN